jgi:hypothetical protein
MRLIACGLLVTVFAGAARAGELDQAVPTTAGPAKIDLAKVTGGSELDNESPAQAHYWRHGWWGGYGRVGFGWGWGGFSRPWGWGNFPGFVAYPGWYRGFSPSYWAWSWGWGGWGWPVWWW